MPVPQLFLPARGGSSSPSPSPRGPSGLMVPIRRAGGGIAKIGSAVAGKGTALAGKVQNSKAGKFVSGGLSRANESGGRLVARIKQNDSVGAVVLDVLPEMTASTVQGFVNGTKVGKAIKDKIWLDASTVGLIFGAVVRFFKLDAKAPKIRAANTAQMKAEITVLGRTFGTRVPGAFAAFLAPDGGAGSAMKKLAVGAVKPIEGKPDPAGDESNPSPQTQSEIPEA